MLLANNYAAAYSARLLHRPLVASYLATKDEVSFVTLLRDFSCGIYWQRNKSNEPKEAEFGRPDHRQHVGIIVLDAVKRLLREKSGSACVRDLFEVRMEF